MPVIAESAYQEAEDSETELREKKYKRASSITKVDMRKINSNFMS